jgi:hypothetical protein
MDLLSIEESQTSMQIVRVVTCNKMTWKKHVKGKYLRDNIVFNSLAIEEG